MTDPADPSPGTPETLAAAPLPPRTALPPEQEAAVRKYEARMSLLKIVYGTALVGALGVLVPGAVEFWDSYFERRSAIATEDLQRNRERRALIDDYFSDGINGDIQHRIRMSEFFVAASDGSGRSESSDSARWATYRDRHIEELAAKRDRILELEKLKGELAAVPHNNVTTEQAATLRIVNLELTWLYNDLRYKKADDPVTLSPEESKRDCAGNTPRDADMAHLHPALRRSVSTLLTRLREENIPFEVFEGFRSPDRQANLYARGRTTPGTKLTWVRSWNSLHQYGLSVDLVLKIDGKWSWDDQGPEAQYWTRLHELAPEYGLVGFYASSGRLVEKPGLYLAGASLKDLKGGTWPSGGDASWADNLQAHIDAWSGCEDQGAPLDGLNKQVANAKLLK